CAGEAIPFGMNCAYDFMDLSPGTMVMNGSGSCGRRAGNNELVGIAAPISVIFLFFQKTKDNSLSNRYTDVNGQRPFPENPPEKGGCGFRG
ncbi:MAG: hypothetical protein R6U50_18670, partial [Desulfobacterales bacterium]